MAAIPQVAPSAPGKTAVGAAIATYGGQTAEGLSISHNAGGKFTVSLGAAVSNGGPALLRAEIGTEF